MRTRFCLARAVAVFLMSAGMVMAQPRITGFTPAMGAPNDTVQLSGNGFTQWPLTVRFWNNRVAVIEYVSSDTTMTVYVPSGISTGPISIQQGSGPITYTTANFLAIGAGPYISGCEPSYGAVNDQVVIHGAHLTGVTAVKFNNVNQPDFSPSANGSSISTRVPPGATSGLVTVTTPYGAASSPTPFTVIGPGPFISGFSPAEGNPGTRVYIEGRFFTGATSAKFNGVPGANFVLTSDTLIQVDTPAGAMTGPITVGNYTTSSNFYVPPVITNITPRMGRMGTNVIISGRSFIGTSAVLFNVNGLPCTNFIVLNNSTIRAEVPRGATNGPIQVIAPAASAIFSNFTVLPTLYAFTPNTGPVGTAVTIYGANLNSGTPVVRFNGVQATVLPGYSFNQLTALVPAGATTGPISVQTADGSHTNENLFYLPARITQFSPTNGVAGTTVTIRGTNFLGTGAVTFNGIPAARFTVTNNNTIGAVVPDNLLTGPISLSTPAGGVTTPDWFYGPPGIAVFSPQSGLPGTTVTFFGSNFLGATSITFSGAPPVQPVVVDNYSVQATVPANALTGPVTLAAPGGTSTTTNAFRLDYQVDILANVYAPTNPTPIGNDLVFTLSTGNQGHWAAANVRLTNVLTWISAPTGLVATIKSASTTQGTVSFQSNVLTGDFGTMVAGSFVNVTMTVGVQGAGRLLDRAVLLSTATATSDYPDTWLPNNSEGRTATILPLAELTIEPWLENQVRVAWPGGLTNYVLQYNAVLPRNPSWLDSTNKPILLNSEYSVFEPTTNQSKFYRLRVKN